MSVTRLGKVVPQTSILFLCDMQEKFRPNISYFPQIVSVAARMLKVAKALEIPIVVTEQYPKGLGLTVQELGAEGLPKYSKTCFSMLIPEVEKEMAAVPNLKSVLLCGIETQACIMSTALDILERGLDVHVVADACSSPRWTGSWPSPGCARAAPFLPPVKDSSCSSSEMLRTPVSERSRS
ncbi:isochorismatase domain-containing protein 2 isoform X2 [Hemicordylus capensis]|uniref:isochorismatase domain-containing protein 2 isoform X2 n=1 Tax=Hemicordylus capensis TaxID=884348 RepID=UPI0023030031|nr:isochorismatase domain-containing protein 2 isoform X2 [Hemicordylus capensis]